MQTPAEVSLSTIRIMLIIMSVIHERFSNIPFFIKQMLIPINILNALGEGVVERAKDWDSSCHIFTHPDQQLVREPEHIVICIINYYIISIVCCSKLHQKFRIFLSLGWWCCFAGAYIRGKLTLYSEKI